MFFNFYFFDTEIVYFNFKRFLVSKQRSENTSIKTGQCNYVLVKYYKIKF